MSTVSGPPLTLFDSSMSRPAPGRFLDVGVGPGRLAHARRAGDRSAASAAASEGAAPPESPRRRRAAARPTVEREPGGRPKKCREGGLDLAAPLLERGGEHPGRELERHLAVREAQERRLLERGGGHGALRLDGLDGGAPALVARLGRGGRRGRAGGGGSRGRCRGRSGRRRRPELLADGQGGTGRPRRLRRPRRCGGPALGLAAAAARSGRGRRAGGRGARVGRARPAPAPRRGPGARRSPPRAPGTRPSAAPPPARSAAARRAFTSITARWTRSKRRASWAASAAAACARTSRSSASGRSSGAPGTSRATSDVAQVADQLLGHPAHLQPALVERRHLGEQRGAVAADQRGGDARHRGRVHHAERLGHRLVAGASSPPRRAPGRAARARRACRPRLRGPPAPARRRRASCPPRPATVREPVGDLLQGRAAGSRSAGSGRRWSPAPCGRRWWRARTSRGRAAPPASSAGR